MRPEQPRIPIVHPDSQSQRFYQNLKHTFPEARVLITEQQPTQAKLH